MILVLLLSMNKYLYLAIKITAGFYRNAGEKKIRCMLQCITVYLDLSWELRLAIHSGLPGPSPMYVYGPV